MPRGVEYVGTDILADPNIGIGRGAFYEARVGPFARVQADGEHLPFADGAFDLVYCVAALHHALDLGRMVSELARVTRRGGIVAALNEGTRAVRASGEVEDQEEEKGFGINEHVHTLYAYLWAFARAGLLVRRVEHAEGDRDLEQRRIGGRLRRLPVVGRSAATWFAQTCYGYSGVSLFARKLDDPLRQRDDARAGRPSGRDARALPAGRRRDPRRGRRPCRAGARGRARRRRRPADPLPVRRAGRPAARLDPCASAGASGC